ncbi:hypothetical protein ABZP36_017285 [Zizania latifolia]
MAAAGEREEVTELAVHDRLPCQCHRCPVVTWSGSDRIKDPMFPEQLLACRSRCVCLCGPASGATGYSATMDRTSKTQASAFDH